MNLSHLKWSMINLEPVTESEVSQREKEISYVNAYIWTLEKWHWWTYLQGRNSDRDIEDGLVDTVGEGEGGTNQQSSSDIYTALRVIKLVRSCYMTQGAQPHTVMI